jgi:sulfite exporter TauE/SafE
MGSGQSALKGLKSFAVFTLGRIFMCAALGLASGYIGATFISVESDLQYVRLVYSSVLILVGLLMLVHPVCKNCKQSKEKTRIFAFFSQRFAFNPTAHLLIMGMAFAMIPCPPMGLMSLFGVGTAVSPLIIICTVAGWFSKKIKIEVPQYMMMFQRLSGVILILLGGLPVIF